MPGALLLHINVTSSKGDLKDIVAWRPPSDCATLDELSDHLAADGDARVVIPPTPAPRQRPLSPLVVVRTPPVNQPPSSRYQQQRQSSTSYSPGATTDERGKWKSVIDRCRPTYLPASEICTIIHPPFPSSTLSAHRLPMYASAGAPKMILAEKRWPNRLAWDFSATQPA